MTKNKDRVPPNSDEFELTLFGPGYGESMVMHIGDNVWIVIDSYTVDKTTPRALQYFNSIGLEPSEVVTMIVATHWHDDHILGMSKILEECSSADFCCAGAFSQKEFIAKIRAHERRPLYQSGSGITELYNVILQLTSIDKTPIYAFPNRVICKRKDCKVWSLSPNDNVFQDFYMTMGRMIAKKGEHKKKIPNRTPNELAVTLLVETDNFALLLGSDLEKRGWATILKDRNRPSQKASVFKVPHHGSEKSDKPEVWQEMLEDSPIAILTPWNLAGQVLPGSINAERILKMTSKAYASSKPLDRPQQSIHHSNELVAQLKANIQLQPLPYSAPLSYPDGLIRLRRPFAPGTSWTIETFGDACHLNEHLT